MVYGCLCNPLLPFIVRWPLWWQQSIQSHDVNKSPCRVGWLRWVGWSLQHRTLTQETRVGFPFQTDSRLFFYHDLFITIIVCYYSCHDDKGAAYLAPYGLYFRRCSFGLYQWVETSLIYGHILKVGRLFASISSLYLECLKRLSIIYLFFVHQELAILISHLSHLFILVCFVNAIINVNKCLSYCLPRLMRQLYQSAFVYFYWLYMYSCYFKILHFAVVLKHLNNQCGC